MSTGGSIQEATIRGRVFSVAADADASRKLGGYENEVQMNGDGTARVVKTRTSWALTGLTFAINDNRGDHEFLQDIADGVEADDDGFYTVSVTFASGATWQGRGTITGEIAWGSQNTTAGVELAGPGTLTRQ